MLINMYDKLVNAAKSHKTLVQDFKNFSNIYEQLLCTIYQLFINQKQKRKSFKLSKLLATERKGKKSL